MTMNLTDLIVAVMGILLKRIRGSKEFIPYSLFVALKEQDLGLLLYSIIATILNPYRIHSHVFLRFQIVLRIFKETCNNHNDNNSNWEGCNNGYRLKIIH